MTENEQTTLGWEQYEAESAKDSRFFKPELNKRYEIVLGSAALTRKTFNKKDANGNVIPSEPKLVASCVIVQLNGTPVSQEWNTSAKLIMEAIRARVKDGTLTKTRFLLKQYQDGGRTAYVFEPVGEVQGPTGPAPQHDFLEHE